MTTSAVKNAMKRKERLRGRWYKNGAEGMTRGDEQTIW
jgi:hypothetical protein